MPMLKTTTNEAKLVNMSGTAPATEPTVWRRYTGRQCVVQRCMTEQTYRVTTDELDVLTCNCSIREDWIDEWRFQDGRPVIFRPCPTAGRSPAVVPRQPALSAGLSALVSVPSSNAVRIDYFAERSSTPTLRWAASAWQREKAAKFDGVDRTCSEFIVVDEDRCRDYKTLYKYTTLPFGAVWLFV